jgi:DNA-binding transcriptional LysR family regulator
VYSACRDVFDRLAGIEQRLSDLRGLKAGSLRIAASTTAKYLVPRLLAEFVKVYPGIEVSLHVNCRQALLQRLAENADDLYIFGNPPEEEDIVVQRILPNPLVAFAPAHHPLACETMVPFERFAREPLLVREPGSGTRMAVDRVFTKHAIEPAVRMELGSDEAIKEAMLAGLGVAILCRHSLGFDLDPAKLATLDIEGFPIESHWHLVYPVGKQLSLILETFIEFVRREAQRVISRY